MFSSAVMKVAVTMPSASDSSGSMTTVDGSRLTRIWSCTASTAAWVVGSTITSIWFELSNTTHGSVVVRGANRGLVAFSVVSRTQARVAARAAASAWFGAGK